MYFRTFESTKFKAWTSRPSPHPKSTMVVKVSVLRISSAACLITGSGIFFAYPRLLSFGKAKVSFKEFIKIAFGIRCQ
jgi:hypothetical protein